MMAESTFYILMAGLLLSLMANVLLALALKESNVKYMDAAGDNALLRSEMRKNQRLLEKRRRNPRALENGRWKDVVFREAMAGAETL